MVKCEVEHRLVLEHRDDEAETRRENFRILKRGEESLVGVRSRLKRMRELWKS